MKRHNSHLLAVICLYILVSIMPPLHAADNASRPFFDYPLTIPGTIQMHWFDEGGEGVAFHEADERNVGSDVRNLEGVDIKRSGGDFYLGWLTGDEWVNYSVNVVDHAMYRVEARVASEVDGGMFRLEFTTPKGEHIDAVDLRVLKTGAWENWTYVYGNITLPAGPARMRLVHLSDATFYNIERVRFRRFDPFDINRDGVVKDPEPEYVRLLGVALQKNQPPKQIKDMNFAPADETALLNSINGWRPLDGSTLSKDAPWKLVWSDEFDNDGKPDPKKWKYETGYLLRNREAQHYTDQKKNAYVKDDHLIIEAIKEKSKAPNGKTADYTSASLYSAKPFLYGRIDVRAKLPTGRGMWPAIWMLADRIGKVRWPLCGEIDIMENVGYDPHVIHGSVHTLKYNHTINTHQSSSWELDKPWENFHVYGIEWYPERIDFYIDRVKYMTFANEGSGEEAWPFDNPHNLKLNIAVGGMWGGVKGIDDSIFPQQMVIDYVRVYEAKKENEM